MRAEPAWCRITLVGKSRQNDIQLNDGFLLQLMDDHIVLCREPVTFMAAVKVGEHASRAL